jgi:pimeloyl-[acyl-carrier protein] methyl ester esterase
MIVHRLVQQNNPRLIIFCNGWGMDQHPFSRLETDSTDVLILSDYRDFKLPVDMDELSRTHETIDLLGWSFGVWAAQQLFHPWRDTIRYCIAINGTLQPIDDRCGIPHQYFNATRAQFSDSVRTRFYRRMCRPQQILDSFLEQQPARTVADQAEELEALARLVRSGADTPPIFDAAVISSADLIIPTAHQLHFWRGRCRIIEVEGGHFPFGAWSGWSDIIDMVTRDGG